VRTRLEDVERLELDAAALVLEQDHHELQVVHLRNVPHHRLHIGAVQQDLAQKLRGENM